MRKSYKVIIDKKGNCKVQTLEGFSGTECHATLDSVMAGVGTCTKQGDTDDYYKTDDPLVFAVDR